MDDINRTRKLNNKPPAPSPRSTDQQLNDAYRVNYGFQLPSKRLLNTSGGYLNKTPKYLCGMNPHGFNRSIRQSDTGILHHNNRNNNNNRTFSGYCDYTDVKSNSMDSSYFPANFKSDPQTSPFGDNQNNFSLNWYQTFSMPSGSFSNEQPSIESISPLPSAATNTENDSMNSSCSVATAPPEFPEKSKPSRSMITLCEMFLQQYTYEASLEPICPNVLSQSLNIERRRVYDLINILVGVDLVRKAGRGCCYWNGLKCLPGCLVKLKTRLNHLITNNNNINNRDDKSISYMARRFLALVVSSNEPIDIEQASLKLYPGIFHNKINSTILRRLYDVGIVYCCLGLLNKVRTNRQYGSKRFSYEFCGFDRVKELYQNRTRFASSFRMNSSMIADRGMLQRTESSQSFDNSSRYQLTHSDDHSYSIEGLIGGSSATSSSVYQQPYLNSIQAGHQLDFTDDTDTKFLADYSITVDSNSNISSFCGSPPTMANNASNKSNDSSKFSETNNANDSSKFSETNNANKLNDSNKSKKLNMNMMKNMSNESEFKENLVQLLQTYNPGKRKLLCDHNFVDEVISMCEKNEKFPPKEDAAWKSRHHFLYYRETRLRQHNWIKTEKRDRDNREIFL